MQHLILRPGPQLVIRAFRPEPDGNRLKEVDVTGRAHEHLFELVTVHAETTLADIFRLMEASPLLQKFYRRDFAEELCAEARKGAAEPPARERAAHEGIEFLELYQEWGLDTSTNEYSGMQRLHLHGIGHELAEDLPEERRKKGERIEWSVSLTPLRELLSLPVRVKDEVRITEEDATAKAYMSEIRRARCADVRLGQVIHGLVWELSFHGGPQEQLEVSEDLKRQVAEVDAGTVEFVSADDVFEPPCDDGAVRSTNGQTEGSEMNRRQVAEVGNLAAAGRLYRFSEQVFPTTLLDRATRRRNPLSPLTTPAGSLKEDSCRVNRFHVAYGGRQRAPDHGLIHGFRSCPK
jgi:hypothetical protein